MEFALERGLGSIGQGVRLSLEECLNSQRYHQVGLASAATMEKERWSENWIPAWLWCTQGTCLMGVWTLAMDCHVVVSPAVTLLWHTQ